MLDFDTSVRDLSRVGATTASKLKRLGIETAGDLLWHLPLRYDDLSLITPIAEIPLGERVTVKGKITLLSARRSFRRRMIVTEAQVEDNTGVLKAIWFKQKFVSKILKAGDDVYLTGKVTEHLGQLQMSSPLYDKVKQEQLHAARIVPIYPSTANVTSKQIRFLIQQVLPLADTVDETLPDEIVQKEKFPSVADALRQIHFPDSWDSLQAATNRLKFEELLWLQMKIVAANSDYTKHTAIALPTTTSLSKDRIAGLPFQLTGDQQKALTEVLLDLSKATPMNRLIEGDVGSGKTIVALLAAEQVISHGYQASLMAPTELLAMQHFNSARKILPDISIALLTSQQHLLAEQGETGEVPRKKILDNIQQGNVGLIIGTHSLIQQDVIFSNLALAIIDEQHRFGVEQRKKLLSGSEGNAPHLLSMTATPIPRTLSLTLYGDLHLSLIREKPAQRKKIITKLVDHKNRAVAYEWILQHIKKGSQLFVICPLVKESEKLNVASVLETHADLKNHIYPQLDVRFVHGKMKSEEKNSLLEDFRDKKFPILVASSVVEVGIDIPGATMMLIEGAERFGLAQLHQLRGRIGRNDQQAFCFLFTTSEDTKSTERLTALTAYDDGFKLSEIDLELRGAGDVFGTAQSGLIDLKVARLTDTAIIKNAREWAEKLLQKYEQLDSTMQHKIDSLAEGVHLE